MRLVLWMFKFVKCECDNETFVDGGNEYLRVGGMDMSFIRIILEDGSEKPFGISYNKETDNE